MARLHGAIPRLMAWIAVVVGLCLFARSATAATRNTYTLPYGYDPEFGLTMFSETIEVDATGVISDVDVFLSFFHDYEGDIDFIELTSPAGMSVSLYIGEGESDDVVWDAVYVDDAGDEPLDGLDYYNGERRTPVEPLSTFDGQPANGTWTFRISDNWPSLDDGFVYELELAVVTGAISCGDSVVNFETEACDDGGTDPNDGCSPTCTREKGYVCDDSHPTVCTVEVCGNSVTVADAMEACDDGNTAAGDGCSPTCTVEPGYECHAAPDGVADICDFPSCGNGLVNFDNETCDDGNSVPMDGCTNCTVDPGYFCINTVTHQPSSCDPYVCGNGIVQGTERCDDGNNVDNGDGCRNDCTVYDNCFGHLVLTESAGTIRTTLVAANYAPGSHCVWTIAAPNASFVVYDIDFAFFPVDDVVRVYDGNTTDAPLIASINGAQRTPFNLLPELISCGPTMTIEFESDPDSIADLGLQSSFWACTADALTVLNTTTGTELQAGELTSRACAGNADPGANNQTCGWRIVHDGFLEVLFADWDLLPGERVIARDANGTVLASYAPDDCPSPLAFTGAPGSVDIVFVSNATLAATGTWSAAYQAGGCTAHVVPTLRDSVATFTDGSGPVGEYRAYTRCGWRVEPPGADLILATFDTFELELGYDYLYVYDGSDATGNLIGGAPLSGILPGPIEVVGTSGSLYMEFYSDEAVVEAGFQLSYVTDPCRTTPVVVPNVAGRVAIEAGTVPSSGGNACMWALPAANTTIFVEHLNLTDGVDTLEFYYFDDGNVPPAPFNVTPSHAFATNAVPAPFGFYGGSADATVVVRVATNGSSDPSFAFNFHAGSCFGTSRLYEASGAISDGSFAGPYGNDLYCGWYIDPSLPGDVPARHIQVTFSALDLQPGLDVVNVYTGTGADDDSTLFFSTGLANQPLPLVVDVFHETALLKFLTDAATTAGGWSLTFVASADCPPGSRWASDLGRCDWCVAGSASPGGPSTVCTACAPGTIAANDRAAVCEPCGNGTVAAGNGNTVCEQCSIGQMSEGTGADACVDCRAGSFAPVAKTGYCTPCPPGEFQDREAQGRCERCAAGFAATEPGQALCDPCQPGYFEPLFGSSNCSACEPGSAAPNPGSTICERCAIGRYQPGQGVPQCLACPSNADTVFLGADRLADCSCKPGYYGPNGAACAPCPEGAECVGRGDHPVPLDGWYIYTGSYEAGVETVVEVGGSSEFVDGVSVFVPCSPPEACLGGFNASCGEGYTGFRCGECTIGTHYRLGGSCVDCPLTNWRTIVLTIITILLPIVFAVLFLRAVSKSFRTGAGAIAVDFLQTAALSASFALNWPAAMVNFWNTLSSFNLNFDLLGTECTLSLSFRVKYLFMILVPLGMLVVFGLVYLVMRLVDALCGERHGRMIDRIAYMVDWRFFVNAFLMLLSVAHPYLTSISLLLFRCSADAHGRFYLDAEPSMFCYEGEWLSLLPVAVTGIVVYVAGIPLLFWIVLYRGARKGLLDERPFKKTFGSIFIVYRKESWYWEILVKLRKLVLQLIVFFVPATANGIMWQAVGGLAVLSVNVYWYDRVEPFRYRPNNRLNLATAVGNVLLLFSGLLYYADKFNERSQAVLTVVTISVAVILGLYILYGTVREFAFYYRFKRVSRYLRLDFTGRGDRSARRNEVIRTRLSTEERVLVETYMATSKTSIVQDVWNLTSKRERERFINFLDRLLEYEEEVEREAAGWKRSLNLYTPRYHPEDGAGGGGSGLRRRGGEVDSRAEMHTISSSCRSSDEDGDFTRLAFVESGSEAGSEMGSRRPSMVPRLMSASASGRLPPKSPSGQRRLSQSAAEALDLPSNLSSDSSDVGPYDGNASTNSRISSRISGHDYAATVASLVKGSQTSVMESAGASDSGLPGRVPS